MYITKNKRNYFYVTTDMKGALQIRRKYLENAYPQAKQVNPNEPLTSETLFFVDGIRETMDFLLENELFHRTTFRTKKVNNWFETSVTIERTLAGRIVAFIEKLRYGKDFDSWEFSYKTDEAVKRMIAEKREVISLA